MSAYLSAAQARYFMAIGEIAEGTLRQVKTHEILELGLPDPHIYNHGRSLQQLVRLGLIRGLYLGRRYHLTPPGATYYRELAAAESDGQ